MFKMCHFRHGASLEETTTLANIRASNDSSSYLNPLLAFLMI